MPTYEYQCQDCGHRVEYFQSMTEPARTVCPRCQGRLRRLVSSGAGLIFKGSGFYVTDYKQKENGRGRKSPQKPDGESSAPAAVKDSAPVTDTKSD